MASKVVLTSALFDQFISFLSELEDMYPNDTDFPVFSTSIKLLKSANPSILAKYIRENTSGFEDKIMNKDEEFFLTNDFNNYSGYVDMKFLKYTLYDSAQLGQGSIEPNDSKYL